MSYIQDRQTSVAKETVVSLSTNQNEFNGRDFSKDPSFVTEASLYLTPGFNGEFNESFPLTCRDIGIYIVSENGLFRFKSTVDACHKIASKKFVDNNSDLQSMITLCKLQDGQCYHLNKKEVLCIEECTKISYQFRGVVKTELSEAPYETVYRIAEELIRRETLPLDLESISSFAFSSEFILALVSPPENRNDPTYLVYWPELTLEEQHHLKPMIDMDMVNKNTLFVDLIRNNTAGKTPSEIAGFFEAYCERFFNDSVLAEKWKMFADTIA